MALTTGTVHTYSQNTWAYSDVVAAPDGSFYVAHKLSSAGIAVKKWNDTTATWDAYTSFTTSNAGHTNFSDYLDLAVDQSGHLHIVFQHEDGGGLSSFRGVSYGFFNGTSWTFNQAEESSHPSGWLNYYDPSIAVEADGDPHVTFILDAATNHIDYVRYGTNETGPWVTNERTNGGSGGTFEVHNPTINVGANGTLYLTYVKEDGQNSYYGNLYFQQKPSGGNWSAEVKLVDAVALGKDLFFTDSGIDENGALHTFYVDGGALYDVTNASGSWATVQVLDASHNVTGVRGYQEVEHVEFLLVTKGGSDTDLYYRQNNGTWQAGNQALSGEAETAFAVNKDGVMMIITETSDLRTIGFATDLAANNLNLGGVAETPSLVVTTLDDVVDAFDGETSLREALAFANSENGADTITFQAGLTGTIRLTGGTLVITDAVTIDGDARILITGDVNDDDATVGATDVTDVAATAAGELDDNVKIFHVQNSVAVTLDGLTITGAGTAGSGRNGAISSETGAISLIGTTVTGNAAAGIAAGGGTIDVDSTSTVRGATYGILVDNGAGGNATTVMHVVVDGGTVEGGVNGIRIVSALADTVSVTSATVIGAANGTAIRLGTGANTLYVAGNNTIPGNSNDAIDGNSGIDTLDFSGHSNGITVNLSSRSSSGAGNLNHGSFENVIGSGFADAISGDGFANMFTGGAHNDAISGNDGDDELHGGDGNDNIFGGWGNDRMYGGAGNDGFRGGPDHLNGITKYADYFDGGDDIDTVFYWDGGWGSGSITVNLETGTASGGHADGDTLIDIENVVGTEFADILTGDGEANTLTGFVGNDTLNGGGNNDTLNGDAGDDELNGGADNDTLNGGAGADDLDGGDGNDTASYVGSGGVIINLKEGTASGGDAQGDTLTSIENISGSNSADTLTGDDNANVLEGVGGDDILEGLGGADLLIGANGDDTASYEHSPESVVVSLQAGSINTGGDAAGDILVTIDNIRGSEFDDTLTGNSGANVLAAGGGNDTLDGGNSNLDVARFFGASADYTVTRSGNTYTVKDNREGSPDGTDTVTNVETFRFSDGDFDPAVLSVDTTGPVLQSATISGNSLVLTYNEVLNTASPLSTVLFDVRVNGSQVALGATEMPFGGSTITLVLASPVVFGDVVTFSYTDPTGANDENVVEDVTGNDAASVTNLTVTNNTADAANAIVSGRVWNDVDSDGVQDAGEGYLPDATVILTGPNTYITTTTDGNGGFTFTGLKAGTYTATLTAPNGYPVATYDADGTANNTASVTVAASQNKSGIDFGVRAVNVAPTLTGDRTASVDEGASYQLTTDDLNFTDPDDDAAGVTFMVSGLTNGTILIGGSAVTTFTGAQLAAGVVSFLHDGSEATSASFNVSVEDGNEDNSAPIASVFSLTVNPVNDAPRAENLTQSLTVDEDSGATPVFTLPVTVSDADSAQLTLVMKVPSGAGSLSGAGWSDIGLEGSDLVYRYTGTLSEILDNLRSVKFQPNANFSGTTTVSVAISDDADNPGETDPAGIVSITVNPVNDPPVLTGDRTAPVNEGGSYTLTTTDLNYTDVDDDAAGVTFTVSGLTNGTIRVNGNVATTFTGEQLANGLVRFHHDGSETAAASFNVAVDDSNEDGSTPVAQPFSLTVGAVNNPPVLTGDRAATVAEGGNYQLTTTDLNYTDVDDDAAGITFTVSALTNGTIRVNGNLATNFTGEQLANGLVRFHHDGSETTTASFNVAVDDGNEDGSAPVAQPFTLTVNPVNDAPVLTGDRAAPVNEGGSYVLTTTDLNYTDVDDDAAGVTFTVSNLVNGTIRIGGSAVTTFTGAQLAAGVVSFLHDGSETTSASFSVSVDDGNEDGSTPVAEVFNLTVGAVNEAPVLTGDRSAPVSEGGSYTLTTDDLNYTDVDDNAAGVTFTVSSLVNGTILVGGSAATTFTGMQFAAGQVSFLHDGSETPTASFNVSVDDGNEDGSTPVAQAFTLTVTAVNDAPALTGDRAAPVDEGGSYTLTTTDLNYTDVDDDAAGVTFTVSALTNGTILVGGSAATTFTGTQLAAGQVSFLHDGSETTTASFDVSVDDGNEDGSAPVAQAFTLAVNPIDDTPPSITIDPFAGDDVVDVAEGAAVITVSGSAPGAEEGQAVTLRLQSKDGATTFDTWTAAVLAGIWSLDLPAGATAALSDGEYRLTANVSDAAGNPAPEATRTITVDTFVAAPPVNIAPVNTVPGLQTLGANTQLAIGGLAVSDPDAGAGQLTTKLSVLHGTLNLAALGGADVSGSGSATVTITGTLAEINATLAGSNVVYACQHDYFGADKLTMMTNDNGNTGTGGGLTDTDQVAIKVGNVQGGGTGSDSFIAPSGTARIDALLGADTITFDFRLTDAQISWSGDRVIIEGPSSRTVLTGFEVFKFTDGTVNNVDGNRMIDDLFYYARNHDVWNAHVDADAHYNTYGWHENRDPNAFFSTSQYLSANPDVAAAGVNPFTHFEHNGWLEGRSPSFAFDVQAYLAANPDVAARGINPLNHYQEFGYDEGRQPISRIAENGFDYSYYLQKNPDVAAAGVDPFAHFQTTGWREGRDPNAFFDTDAYLAAYGDVKKAGVNPLDHYHGFGWHEGRDPSTIFDTSSYLAAYGDVQAAGIDPLRHFVQFGQHENRASFSDGVLG